MESQKLDEQVTIGAQPTEADVEALARQGFRSVINLRKEGEDDQPLSPTAEEQAAANAGLRYVHLPVSFRDLESSQIDQFRTEMETLPAPVYVHCRGGSRARLLVTIQQAIQSGQSGKKTVRSLQETGLLDDSDVLYGWIGDYVDQAVKRRD